MKIIVVGVVGSILLCAAAAAGGFYVGKLTKPVSLTRVEKAKVRIPTKSPGHSEMMSPGIPT